MALSAALATMVAGCAGGAPSTPAPPEALEGSWELAAGSLDGEEMAPLDTHPITLTFRGAEIGGTSACNQYGGRITVVDGVLRIGEIGQTAMGCEPEVMELEAAYTAALQRVTALERRGEELAAAGDGVELRFVQLPPPPTADLVDTVWVLDSVVMGDAAAAPMGERATLELRSDGTFSGSTGCRSFEGRWIESGGEIDMPEWGLEGECPAQLAQQDSHVVTVLGDGFTAVVDGDRVTLSDPTGEALVYRAEE